MSTTSAFQKQEDFRADRVHVIGGSDVHNLFDLAPYGCNRRLAYQKTEVIPDFFFHGNSATERGNTFERFAAEVYAETTGRTIRKAHPVADKLVPVLRPQPDFEIVNDARGPEWGRGVLSIKVPGREMFIRLKAALEWLKGREARSEWEKKQQEEGLAALRPYQLQGQAECGPQKVKWYSFAFFWADGMQIEYADVDADGEIMDSIRAAAQVFWDTKESKGVEGFPRLDPKSKQCGRCEFRVTCQSANLLKLLESANRDIDTTKSFPVLPVLDGAVHELWERQELQDEAGALVDETKEKIRQILSDCDAAEGFETRAYNSLRNGRLSVQREPLMKFVKELAARAESLAKHANDSELNMSEYVLAANLLLDDVAKLDAIIESKFVNKGKPYRELRTYPIKKKEAKA